MHLDMWTRSRRPHNHQCLQEKYPLGGISVREKALLILELRGEWPDWFVLIGRQLLE